MILLDTDVVIDIWRRLPRLSRVSDEQIVLPGFVVMELVSKRELRLLNTHFRGVSIVWPAQNVCDNALADFARLRFSHGIGLLDTLVAHIAVD